MITIKGKQIIAKYLIGQTQAYASYIAIGCGGKVRKLLDAFIDQLHINNGVANVKTLSEHDFSYGDIVKISGTGTTLDGLSFVVQEVISSIEAGKTVIKNFTFFTTLANQVIQSGYCAIDFSDKSNLDFEMFRVPISSRGFVNEDGVSKIVFTAELPTEERYEMTEIGIYSAGANTDAGLYDSRVLYSFNQNENWEYHTLTLATKIPVKNAPLDANGTVNIINIDDKVFYTTSDNSIFAYDGRVRRNERGRFLNDTIMISGDSSKLIVNQDGSLELDETYNSSHIHLNGVSPDFNRQSPIDEIRLAFSIVNKNGNDGAPNPSRVLILGQFASDDALYPNQKAEFCVDISHTDEPNALNNFSTNRYFVVTKQLQELIKTPGFSWGSVDISKIFVSILDADGNPTSDYYVALDGVRIENIGSVNPLYGLVGYSRIVDTNSSPIIKLPNTTNYVEFRSNVGVY